MAPVLVCAMSGVVERNHKHAVRSFIVAPREPAGCSI
jgi:hypothetical protein